MVNLARPLGYIIVALLGLALLMFSQAGPLISFFNENLAVNLMILAVFIFGLGLSFWRLTSLAHEMRWLARIRTATRASNADALAGPSATAHLTLLKPFASIWRRFFGTNQALTPALASSLVEAAQARVDERRELSRYLITALVILGLIGTFWGLLGALISMREALGNLDSNQDFFAGLSGSLSGPLENMGTAFSSSLFGLSASLFFGFIEGQTARAHTTFVEDFEIWLISYIRTEGEQGSAPGAPGSQTPTFQGPQVEEIAGKIDTLAHLMRRGQQDTMVLNNNLVALLDQMTKVAEKLTADQTIHEKILATQADQSELIVKITALTDLLTAWAEAPIPLSDQKTPAAKTDAS